MDIGRIEKPVFFKGSKTDADIIVKPDGSRVLVVT